MRPDGLQSLTLATAEARPLDSVLDGIVRGLAEEPGIALARIWLVGDAPAEPHALRGARAPARELVLAASAGRSLDEKTTWHRLDGDFSRIPVGVRKVGLVAASGTALLVERGAPKDPHIARPEWAKREQIESFCGQPLIFRGQVLGVLAVFSRTPIDREAAGWLRAFADHAAVAIANARAFDELARLKDAVVEERDALRDEVGGALAAGPIVGTSEALRKVLRQVELVAPTDATVLVLGESGTGKELIATALHAQSPRRNKPLVRVNCAAVPAELFESEFFGHVRGAFTGALRERAGKFQIADGGTLFLDEIAEIPLSLQGKLLRALQEKTFERVGEDRPRTVDVRVVAATNRDLAAEVAAGRFREDLYFRLSVFPIEVPPLRARREDIGPLARRFLEAACARQGRAPLALTAKDLSLLEAQPWPGNVRELMNAIERAVILSDKTRLRLDLALRDRTSPSGAPVSTAGPTARAGRAYLTSAEWREKERENLAAALAAAGGRVWGDDGAAALLGMKPTTLASRLKALRVRRDASEPHAPRARGRRDETARGRRGASSRQISPRRS